MLMISLCFINTALGQHHQRVKHSHRLSERSPNREKCLESFYTFFNFLMLVMSRWVGFSPECVPTLCVCVCTSHTEGTGSMGMLKWGTLQSCSTSLRQVSCHGKLGKWCVAPITPSPPPAPTEPSSFLPALTPWAVVSIWLFVCMQMLHAYSKHQANGILGDLQALKSAVKPSLWNMEPQKNVPWESPKSPEIRIHSRQGRWIQDQRKFDMKACKNIRLNVCD